MYQYKEVSKGLWVLSLDNHQEIFEALNQFCTEKGVLSGKIEGIGAVNEVTLRFFNTSTKKYVDKTFSEQMEITNLIGNVSRMDGKVYLHLHITLGREDYSVVGGHLLTARINGACELLVRDFNVEIGRRFDPETGINLYDF